MLLQNGGRMEARCPRPWSLVASCGLLALAVVLAGARLQTVEGAPAPEEKKDAPKKEAPKAPGLIPKAEDFPVPPGLDPAMEKRIRAQMEQMRKQMEQTMKRLPPGLDPAVEKRMRAQMDEMMKRMAERMKPMPGGAPGALPGMPGMPGLPGGIWINPGIGGIGRPREARPGMSESRLGAQLEAPSATLVDQLELPRDQGLVVRELAPNSAGAKGGLKAHDILLELGGKAVSSKLEDFARQLKDLKADAKVDAVVMRKGRKETVKGLTLPEAKEPVRPGLIPFPNLPGAFPGVPAPRIGGRGVGISMSRNGNQFTIARRDNGEKITVKGTMNAGKAELSEAVVEAGGQTNTYDALNKVPQKHQEAVKGLLEMAEKGNVRLRIGGR